MPARKRTAGKAVKKTVKKSAPMMAAKRKDLGAPVDSYFAQQPPEKRALLEKLRGLVAKGVPDADASIKWGVPFYQRNGKNVCSLAAFKEHVGINFFASPAVLADPGKKLEGEGKSMRMLKVRRPEDIDSASILRWLKATVAANSA
ncbi:MAG TPA: DUF1801 domain-containing protein [Candidatus Limnocylindria bacterium]|nr:DUF1801 domain-containing protein [Candidatus Limnocylindria bacterium]